MSYLDNRRTLGALAYRVFRLEKLSKEEASYLGIVLGRIARGEDANDVLGVRPQRGQSHEDAISQQRMSLILHWVAAAIELIPDDNGKKLTVQEACEKAMDTIVPFAIQMFPSKKSPTYDAEYLQRRWSSPVCRHMRSPVRKFFDPDFPYAPRRQS